MRFKIAIILSAIVAFGPSLANAQEVNPAASSFEQLSTLVGDWKRQDTDGSKFHIEFELTANNSVLVERWVRGDKTHSLTLYHRDKTDVVATHYCPQGNQPRMKMNSAAGATHITFDFWDATNLEKQTDNHQHQLFFDLSNSDQIRRGEIYVSGEGVEPSELILERIDEPLIDRPTNGAE